jgi:hypothetical protein
VFSNHFDILILKIIFKKQKNIINIYFNMKNYLKNNHNDSLNLEEVLLLRYAREMSEFT